MAAASSAPQRRARSSSPVAERSVATRHDEPLAGEEALVARLPKLRFDRAGCPAQRPPDAGLEGGGETAADRQVVEPGPQQRVRGVRRNRRLLVLGDLIETAVPRQREGDDGRAGHDQVHSGEGLSGRLVGVERPGAGPDPVGDGLGDFCGITPMRFVDDDGFHGLNVGPAGRRRGGPSGPNRTGRRSVRRVARATRTAPRRRHPRDGAGRSQGPPRTTPGRRERRRLDRRWTCGARSSSRGHRL